MSLNRDELPFMYKDPFNMYVYWICNLDEDDRLVSIFANDENEQGHEHYSAIVTEEQALAQRQALIDANWQQMPKPEIIFKQDKLKGYRTKKMKKTQTPH